MKKPLRSLALGTILLVAAAAQADEQRLRIMAANISSGSFQSYPDPGPGTRIFRAIEPDVLLIQEFNVSSTRNGPNDAAAVRAWVDSVFGSDFHVFREPGGQSIPNGVVSRWPILESGEWDDAQVGDRDFAFARLDIPGDTDLWVVSVHLSTMAEKRRTQARNLVEAIGRLPVPDGDFLVVGGDFNTDGRNEMVPMTLRAVVDVLGPFPNDGGDPPDGDTNANRNKPYDWLLADADLTSREVPLVIGALTFPDGLVFDSRKFTQDELDDNFPPVQRNDSGAPMMQHMAVVRDFRLNVDEAPPAEDFGVPVQEIDFGLASASESPRLDASVRFEIRNPVGLIAVAFEGSHPGEFMLVAPDLRSGPATFEEDAVLTFAWKPAANDGQPRNVKATLITSGEPGAVEIQLRGVAAGPQPETPEVPAGGTLDLAGYRLLQTGGDAALTIPAGTRLAPGGLLVIGRAAGRAEFEAFWGPLPAGAQYLNGGMLAGEPGFPAINGGERYRLLNPGGAPVDPAAGQLPAAPIEAGQSCQRTDTSAATFARLANPRIEATPGRYAGIGAKTGKPIITEIADAPGPGGFVFEFIEIFFDGPSNP